MPAMAAVSADGCFSGFGVVSKFSTIGLLITDGDLVTELPAAQQMLYTATAKQVLITLR